MTITHDNDKDFKNFDCNRQSFGNCTCVDKCENGNEEL